MPTKKRKKSKTRSATLKRAWAKARARDWRDCVCGSDKPCPVHTSFRRAENLLRRINTPAR